MKGRNILNRTWKMLAALAQIVSCLPMVQQVWGSIPSGLVNFQPQG